jgi:Protein of unknown function (DUF3489)
MPKLSDSQLVVLSAACQRSDRAVYPVTLKLKGNAAGNVLKSLVAKGLLEEIQGGADDTLWRHDDGRLLTLRATDAAFAVLGNDSETGSPAAVGDSTPTAKKGKRAGPTKAKRDSAATKTAKRTKGRAKTRTPRAARTDSKQAQLIAMLKRAKGASIEEIIKAFGWQPHTVRGAIAGALKKKLGLAVTSEKIEGRGRVYRIAD